MIEDHMGYFIKASKSSKYHVTRFFILDIQDLTMKCFDDQHQITNKINSSTQINEIINNTQFSKFLPLAELKVGRKTGKGFGIYLKNKDKEIWVVP